MHTGRRPYLRFASAAPTEAVIVSDAVATGAADIAPGPERRVVSAAGWKVAWRANDLIPAAHRLPGRPARRELDLQRSPAAAATTGPQQQRWRRASGYRCPPPWTLRREANRGRPPGPSS